MADLSQMPIEELMRLREQFSPQPAQAPEAPQQQAAPDLSSMPLDQLMALRERMAAPQQTTPSDERPWYSKLGGAADDMARIVANGVTLGAADKFAGYMGGQGGDAEKQLTQEARDRAGSAAIAGDVIGALGPGSLAVKGGAALARGVAPTVAANAGLGLRTAGMGAVGAGLGAGEAAIKDEDIGKGALVGGLAGAGGNLAGEALSAGVSKVAGAFNKAPKIPTNPELRAAADKAYKAADDAGVIFTPQGMQRAQSGIQEELAKAAFLPANQPRVAAVLGEIEKAAGNNNTLTGLDQLRQMASNAYDPQNKASNKMLGKIISQIDDLVTKPGSGEVIAKDAATGSKAITEARDLWSRAAKSETLDQALIKAERRAASTGSGGNADNAIRQNVRGILDNPNKSRGWTADEKAAAEAVVRGSPLQNTARLVGKLSPVGNGLSAMLGIGATAMNPLMAIGPAIGGVAKMAADRATPANAEMLSRIIRAGGDKSAAVAAPNAVQRLAESKREALSRLLMAGGLVAGRQ
jgi:hypothetical protein